MDLTALYLGLAVATCSLPRGRSLRVGGAGLVLAALATAAFRAGAGTTRPAALAAQALTGAGDTGFIAVTAGLFGGGVLVSGAAVVAAWCGGGRLAAAAVTAALLAALWTIAPLVPAAGVSAAGVAALSALLVGGPAWIGMGRAEAAGGTVRPQGEAVPWWWLAAVGAAVGVVGVAPWLWPAIGAATVAGVGGHVVARRLGWLGPVPVLPVLMLPLLAFAWYAAVIAGPVGTSIAALRDGPFSPAAQLALALPPLVAAWGCCGLFPLHRWLPGPVLALLGVLLLARWAAAVAPDGLEHWRALVLPAAALGLWHGALTRRPDLALAAAALAGATSGAALLASGGVPLAVAAGVLALAWRGVLDLPPAVARLAGLAAAWGGYQALAAVLGGEVTYGAILAAGGAVAVARGVGWGRAAG